MNFLHSLNEKYIGIGLMRVHKRILVGAFAAIALLIVEFYFAPLNLFGATEFRFSIFVMVNVTVAGFFSLWYGPRLLGARAGNRAFRVYGLFHFFIFVLAYAHATAFLSRNVESVEYANIPQNTIMLVLALIAVGYAFDLVGCLIGMGCTIIPFLSLDAKFGSFDYIVIISAIAFACLAYLIYRGEIDILQGRQELEAKKDELESSDNSIKILVDNMRQALFSIDAKGLIVEPISKYSKALTGIEMSGQHVLDSLFAGLRSDTESFSLLQTALATVFGEGELQWTMMESCFPTRIRYRRPGSDSGDVRALKIQTSPIWSDVGFLERILFVVEDVTLIENLEREIEEQQEKARLVVEILAAGTDSARKLITQVREASGRLRSLTIGSDGPVSVMRELHTLKGNARLCKMRALSSKLHDQESKFLAQGLNAESGAIQRQFVAQFIAVVTTDLDSLSLQYENVLNELQPIARVNESAKLLSRFAFDRFSKLSKKLADRMSPTDRAELATAVRVLELSSIRLMVERFGEMIRDVSADLQKQIVFEVEGDGLLEVERIEHLQTALMHVLRNSCDHGIESPAVRIARGKAESGKLRILIRQEARYVAIEVSDDGAGIDQNRIREIAIAKGLIKAENASQMNQAQVIDLIFVPGFSTKDAVTVLSGRGIGLDVSRAEVEALGGTIDVTSAIDAGTKFTLKIAC